MRTRFARFIIIALALGISTWAQEPAAPARQGGGASAPTTRTLGPAPRLADGKPDLNGVLNGGLSSQDISLNLVAGEQIVLTPAADKLMMARRT